MATWPYGTTTWARLRAAKLSASPLCEPCEWRGVKRPAKAVDHIISIASGGPAFPELDQLRSMCWPCHSIKTNALDRAGGKGVAFKGCGVDGLPLDGDHPFRGHETHAVTLVCGPPGSGKTSHVSGHRKPGDLVLDLDAIMAALCGDALYQAPVDILPFALKARDAVIERLRGKHSLRHAWIIAGGATRRERTEITRSLDARTVMLDTPAEVCVARINADPRRPPSERAKQIAAVAQWWLRFEPHTPLEGQGRYRKEAAPDVRSELVRDWGI